MPPLARDQRPLLGAPARAALNALLIAAALALAAFVVARLRLVVIPVLIALLLSTLLVPPANLLRGRGVPSALATLASMLLGAGLIAGAVALVGPAFVDEFDNVGESVTEGIDEATRWLVEGPLDLDPDTVDRTVDNAVDTVRDNSGVLAGGVLTGAAAAAEFVAGLLLVIVIVFFFVNDGRRIWTWLVSLVPQARREDAEAIGERVWTALAGYVRGVVVIALIDALAIGLALVLIGVPLVVPLMVLVFFGAFLPLIGAVLAGAVAALVALVTGGFVDALLVVAAITAIQQLEGDLLYPIVVGRAIELHPLAILLLLTAGTVIAGIAGALLAVPFGAAAWVALAHLWVEPRRREAARSA